MKLSEAIRLGAMLRPQAFDGGVSHGKSCAMTAACEAVGVMPWYPGYVTTFPVCTKLAQCPACGNNANVACIAALCLNDKHHWTRERIAQWVSTIEPQETTDVCLGPSEHTELVNDCERV